MKLSFVIPCYRSEKTLAGVVAEIKAVAAQRPDVDYEIVLVSDHSPDGVWGVIERLCAADPQRLLGLELSRNFGQHAALMAGYARTTGDVVFSLDDDGQAPVESVWDVVDKMEHGRYDVVYGTYTHRQHNLFRNVGSWLNQRMSVWLIGQPKGLHITSFFVMRRFVVDEMLKYRESFVYVSGLIFRVTQNIGCVNVQHRARALGSSGYTFAKLLGLWMNGFTAFSVKPLRLATWMGVVCASLGFLCGFWTIIKKLFLLPAVPLGYSSLMAAILFIGGMLMLMLGLIGEYVGRIYICINQRPQFVVARETRRR